MVGNFTLIQRYATATSVSSCVLFEEKNSQAIIWWNLSTMLGANLGEFSSMLKKSSRAGVRVVLPNPTSLLLILIHLAGSHTW